MEFMNVRARTARAALLVMTGTVFSLGLVLGMVLHLPGVSQPYLSEAQVDRILVKHDMTFQGHLRNSAVRHLSRRAVSQEEDGDSSSSIFGEYKSVHIDRDQVGFVSNKSAKRRANLRLKHSTRTSVNVKQTLNKVNNTRQFSQRKQDLHSVTKTDRKSEDSHLKVRQNNKNNQVYGSSHVSITIGSNANSRSGLRGEEMKQPSSLDPNARGNVLLSAEVKTANLHNLTISKDNIGGNPRPLGSSEGHNRQVVSHVNTRSDSDTQFKMADRFHGQFNKLSDIIVDGVYWSSQLEILSPEPFTDLDVIEWRKFIDTTNIVGLKEGCGRMQNRLVIFEDGRRACARYRINTDQMQGEIFSYYLSRLLKVWNVPPSVALNPDLSDPRWSPVHDQVISAQWSDQKVVILTPWLEKLSHAYIPEAFRQDDRAFHPIASHLEGKTPQELQELMQWSDLIVFDYLTANLDRVVNNMFNKQWNPDMMISPAHNLEKMGANSRSANKEGVLVFLDNESGLFHSYRLLDKYSHYHDALLRSLCVFRKTTSDIIKELHRDRNVGEQLMDLFEKQEPLHGFIPRMPTSNIRQLQERIDSVYKQIVKCENTYHQR